MIGVSCVLQYIFLVYKILLRNLLVCYFYFKVRFFFVNSLYIAQTVRFVFTVDEELFNFLIVKVHMILRYSHTFIIVTLVTTGQEPSHKKQCRNVWGIFNTCAHCPQCPLYTRLDSLTNYPLLHWYLHWEIYDRSCVTFSSATEYLFSVRQL